jgi:hypothetical protein
MAGMKTPRSNICAVGASTVGYSDVSRATPAIAGEKLESPPFKGGEYVNFMEMLPQHRHLLGN